MHTKKMSEQLMQENPIGKRLREEMQRLGVNSAVLARQADVKTSFIYDILSGKSSNPSPVKLARVADSLGISLEALVAQNAKGQFGNIMPSTVHVPRLQPDQLAGQHTLVTVHDDAPCYSFNSKWLTQTLQCNPKHARMVVVRDDSMSPTLQEGDSVLIDTSRRQPSPPGMFAIFDGFNLVIKRLGHVSAVKSPQVQISSDNAAYSAYERPLDAISIAGRVIWFARCL